MPYDESLAARVRSLLKTRRVEEKPMMGGLTFMVNGKMCVGLINDDLMARIDPDVYESALERPGCRPMDFTGKPMRGFVFISPEGTSGDLNYWINLALDFNARAKASRKKSSRSAGRSKAKAKSPQRTGTGAKKRIIAKRKASASSRKKVNKRPKR